MEPKVSLNLTPEWKELSFDTSRYITFYTESKSLVDIYETSPTTEIDLTNLDREDIVTIGGVLPICTVYTGNRIFIRCRQEEGAAYYLPKGQPDPEKSIDNIYTNLLSLYETVELHLNGNNPHQLDKGSVRLGNLVNRLSDIIPQEAPTEISIATNVAIYNLNRALLTRIAEITRESLGIDNVANYPIATGDELLDAENDTSYATVQGIHDIFNNKEQSLNNIEPNMVYEAILQEQNPSKIGIYDPKTMSAYLTNNNIVIQKGIRVTYRDQNRFYISHPLATDVTIPKSEISSIVTPKPGYHYLAVDIDEYGIISDIHITDTRPYFGIRPVDHLRDFYHTGKQMMFDKSGTIIRRVYISKIYVSSDGLLSYVTNVPIGTEYIHDCMSVVEPGRRYVFDNPFMDHIEVIPEIQIGSIWADPKWNDQAGVIANYNTSNPDKIIVQTGQMGLAMPAYSSGNSFTTETLPTTYQSTAPIRLIIRRR